MSHVWLRKGEDGMGWDGSEENLASRGEYKCKSPEVKGGL